MLSFIWVFAFLTAQASISESDYNHNSLNFVTETETILFELPEEISLGCGLKLEFDCRNLCKDSLLIPMNSMLIAEFSIMDKSNNNKNYCESIIPAGSSGDKSRCNITSLCLMLLRNHLILPEVVRFHNGIAELTYELRIYKPEIAQEGDEIALVPGDIARSKRYTFRFSQDEFDSLQDCGRN